MSVSSPDAQVLSEVDLQLPKLYMPLANLVASLQGYDKVRCSLVARRASEALHGVLWSAQLWMLNPTWFNPHSTRLLPLLLPQPASHAHFSRVIFDLAAHTGLSRRHSLNLPLVLSDWAHRFSLDALSEPFPPLASSPPIAHAFPSTNAFILTHDDPEVTRVWGVRHPASARARVARFLFSPWLLGASVLPAYAAPFDDTCPSSPQTAPGSPASCTTRASSTPCGSPAACPGSPDSALSSGGASSYCSYFSAEDRFTATLSAMDGDEGSAYELPSHLCAAAEAVLMVVAEEDTGSECVDAKHWPSLGASAALNKKAAARTSTKTSATKTPESPSTASSSSSIPRCWSKRKVAPEAFGTVSTDGVPMIILNKFAGQKQSAPWSSMMISNNYYVQFCSSS